MSSEDSNFSMASPRVRGRRSMPSAASSSSDCRKVSQVDSVGSGSSSSMPFRPAAMVTARARYGLAVGSGLRSSRRVAECLPGLCAGMRTSAERFLRPHVA